MATKNQLPTSNEIEATIKEAIDSNATDNPHATVDPTTGKMAVVGDATQIEVPDYKYTITYEYTEDMLSEEDKKSCKEEDGKFYLTLHYSGKRVKPLYRTKAVMIFTRVLADALVVDTTGYSSDHINSELILKVIDEHLQDILELANIVLGIEKEQLEYMTITSLAEFFAAFMKNEPNIIEECVNFLSQSLRHLEEKQAENQ